MSLFPTHPDFGNSAEEFHLHETLSTPKKLLSSLSSLIWCHISIINAHETPMKPHWDWPNCGHWYEWEMSTYTPFIGESDRDTPEHNVVRPSTPMMWTPTAVGDAVLLTHTNKKWLGCSWQIKEKQTSLGFTCNGPHFAMWNVRCNSNQTPLVSIMFIYIGKNNTPTSITSFTKSTINYALILHLFSIMVDANIYGVCFCSKQS
jgi:hypothetical protein